MTDALTADLVSRLRAIAGKYDLYGWHDEIEREAADELERLERERAEWAAVASDRNVRLTLFAEERDLARATLREVYEVWAGMEGFEPQTAPEAYQRRIIEQMRDAVQRGLGATLDVSGEESK